MSTNTLVSTNKLRDTLRPYMPYKSIFDTDFTPHDSKDWVESPHSQALPSQTAAQAQQTAYMTHEAYNTANNFYSQIYAMIDHFINSTHLLKLKKIGATMDSEYWILASSYLKHIPIKKDELYLHFSNYIHQYNYQIKKSVLDNAFSMLINRIPSQNTASITEPPDSDIVFRNGIFDIKAKTFSYIQNGTNPFITFNFNRFIIPYDMPNPFPNRPIHFDELLKKIFNNDERKIKTLYRIIALILIPESNAWRKGIFIFQGISNSGKTTLANIIKSLICDNNDDTDSFGVYEGDLSSESLNHIKTNHRQYRLWFIDETNGKSLDKTLISNIKKICQGQQSNHTSPVKLLITTNEPIFLSKSSTYPESLRQRTIVLSFDNNNGKDVYSYMKHDLVSERMAIIFTAFQVLMATNNECELDEPCTINECIEGNDDDSLNNFIANLPPSISSHIPYFVKKSPNEIKKERLYIIIDRYFELTPQLNPEMTAEHLKSFIDKIDPTLVKDTNNLGKILKSYYSSKGLEFLSGRTSGSHGKICYNLQLKDLTDISSTI